MSSELLPQLSIVVVFRVLRAGKQDIEPQMGLAHIMKVLYAPSSAQTVSHRNEKKGMDWLRERRMGGGGIKGVQNACWGVWLEAFVLCDGHMSISHWATHRAALWRCWRDKTAMRWGENLVTNQWISISSHCNFSFPLLFPFSPSSTWNRATTIWGWNAGWGDAEHKDQCRPGRVGFWNGSEDKNCRLNHPHKTQNSSVVESGW